MLLPLGLLLTGATGAFMGLLIADSAGGRKAPQGTRPRRTPAGGAPDRRAGRPAREAGRAVRGADDDAPAAAAEGRRSRRRLRRGH